MFRGARCVMVVQGAGVGPIVKRLGERRALLLGMGCGALGFFIYGAAPTGPLFWLGIPVMSLWGISGAAMPPSFRARPQDRSRNLGILRCAIAHRSSMLRIAPG